MGIGDLVQRVYASFTGVDFRGEEVNLVRSPDSKNVWKDYKEIESIRTRPAMEKVAECETPVWGVFFYEVGNRVIQLIHSGTKLYRYENETMTVLYEGLAPRQSQSFVYNNIWYFKDGINYLQYDGDTVAAVEGYVPTTTIGRRPAGGGTTHEDVNMLTGVRKNTFLADGTSTEYYLDAQNIDNNYIPIVTVDGKKVVQFGVDYAEGKIIFIEAPNEPLTDGQDNVEVTFKKSKEDYRDRIDKCTLLCVFDNRVFFSGNPDYPNALWHSSLNEPTYVSDTDYYAEGLDLAQVKGLVAGNNALWVFKEPSQSNTTIFYHNPTLDGEFGKIYPSTHSSISTGCVGKATNFNDDIVFFSDRGMEAIHGDVTTEQAVAHRSMMIDRKLIVENGYQDMILEEWEGYLLVIIGDKIFLADSRGMFTNENHIEYEWFYWEMEQKITCTRVYEGTLYLGTADGVYTLTDYDSAVESYWTTPLDKFKHPQYLKTTNKRGCVVEATGDITLSVRTNKSEWENVGEYAGIVDYFTAKIKRKKFKDIQLRFASKTRFSLEMATLSCHIGGYIKR
jgi:hypothetical protein